MRLRAFDYFRGVAIMLVVAGHSLSGWNLNTLPERAFANLVLGGTSLFVFLAGFFYHHVYCQPGRSHWAFLVAKSKAVATPYVLISTVAFSIYLVCDIPLPYVEDVRYAFGLNTGQGVGNRLQILGAYLWTGRIATGYWFIPFAMVLFVLSPLFAMVTKLSIGRALALIALLLGVSTYVQRPFDNLSPMHAVVYFAPVYMLGMLVSKWRKEFVLTLRGKEWMLLLIILLAAIGQALIFPDVGTQQKHSIFSYHGLSLIIVQKATMSLLFVSVLTRVEDARIPVLREIANASFAIYFLHPWVLKGLYVGGYYTIVERLPGPLVAFGAFLLAVGISFVVARMIKSPFGERSRYLIGY